MPKQRSLLRPTLAAILAVVVIFLALPQSWRTWAPSVLQNPRLHLGLDLAGGTQLDFRISEEEIRTQIAALDKQISEAEAASAGIERINDLLAQKASVQEQSTNLVEAIRTVLERRINSLGVSEATITPSYVGNEKHLLVECPGVVDTQECIKVVGKTIQLEFKEQYTGQTAEVTAEVQAKVAATQKRLNESGSTLQKEGQDLGTQLGISYASQQLLFRDQVPSGLEDILTTKPRQVIRKEASVSCQSPALLSAEFIRQHCVGPDGQLIQKQIPGIFLAAVLAPLTATGRVIDEAPKAFAELARTQSGATYAHREALTLDETVDTRLTTAIRAMQPGQLKAVELGDSARVLFLRGITTGSEEISASHILVAWKGSTQADAGITRTKEQALQRAKQLKTQLDAGSDFAAFARKESDGPSKAQGGSLGAFGRGVMAPSFEAAAFALKTVGQVSEPTETEFGYHLIRLDKALSITPSVADADILTVTGLNAGPRAEEMVTRLQTGKVTTVEPAITVRSLFFSLEPSGWKDTTLDGKHFRHATVSIDPVTSIPVVQIAFDAEGGRLFGELTKRNVGKPIAIFVGGELVSAPNVQQEITGGTAVITGSRNVEDARLLSQNLNTGAIPAPIHLVGQYTVEATLGSQALQTSMMAAAIGAIILMLYMAVMYRLLGLVANAALIVYAFLNYAILKLPLFFFTDNYVVLTLAGMAGIILSLGMAVDANVLVFERMKEELRKGKLVKTAVDSSFKHAWPAIRDGNVATLITCLILFMIGTSIVRGFAITLMIGVLLSMFTAITVTRWLLHKVTAMPGFDRPELYGVRRGGGKHQ